MILFKYIFFQIFLPLFFQLLHYDKSAALKIFLVFLFVALRICLLLLNGQQCSCQNCHTFQFNKSVMNHQIVLLSKVELIIGKCNWCNYCILYFEVNNLYFRKIDYWQKLKENANLSKKWTRQVIFDPELSCHLKLSTLTIVRHL